MFIADNWKDYEVIDTSNGEKLERWGKYILVRPDPQVIWDTPKKERGWKNMKVITTEVLRAAENGSSLTFHSSGRFTTTVLHLNRS